MKSRSLKKNGAKGGKILGAGEWFSIYVPKEKEKDF